MKRLLSLFLATAFILGGCAGDVMLQNPVESQGEVENTIEISDETVESSETSDYVETLSISDELVEEMAEFFQEFLEAYIEGDEETFKPYMSKEFYNDYLEFQINPENYYSSTFFLNMVVEYRLISWMIHTGNHPDVHHPGITFFTRLMTQNDVDTNYDLGSKFLVNISYNEDHEYSINWLTFGIL